MAKSKLVWLALAIIYTIILIYLSLAHVDSMIPVSDEIPIDKIFHLLAYIILSYLWAIWCIRAYQNSYLAIVFISTLLFGILLEGLQEIISPYRTFDWLDLVANCVGVICGTIIVAYLKKSKVKID